ncbi:MAG: 2-phospho-L-lactate guanylyltransferase [Acidobacteria bacterium]|nr:2-phospho-L-lactate guanylyltransferase [Acidobacteriota bacterium]
MNELVFAVTPEPDGGYCAECLSEGIFTQAGSCEVFRDRTPPTTIRLHLVRDEVLPVA